MPQFDLRKDDTTLDDLASFKVLAIMCYPAERIKRERMLALIQSQTGAGIPRRRGLTSDAFLKEVKLHAPRAALAGGLLLTLFQLEAEGYTPSLNRALPIVRATLPEWTTYNAANWSAESHIGHHPHSRRKILKAYTDYRPVVHLWAAMIHGEQHGRKDIWPDSLQTLPTFLSYARAILELGCVLRSPARDRRHALERSQAWVFKTHLSASDTPTLNVLPFNDGQRRILDELDSPNPLS